MKLGQCILPLLFLWAFPLMSYGQNQVNILEADSIVGGVVEGEQVQKILGNVHLDSDDFVIFCDSAYKFQEKSEIRAFGNIEINTEEENIWADTLVYYTDVDFSQLRGRVIIENDSTTLFGNSVDYRFSTKVAHFIDEIRLEDQRGILKANSGFYYREADSAVFRGDVQVSDSTQYVEGDSLFSNRSSEYYELYGNIFADDKENNTLLKGNYLESDSTGRRLIKGDAWLRNVDIDTVYVHPDSVASDTLAPPQADSTQAHADTSGGNQDSLHLQPPKNFKTESDTTHIRAQKIISIQQKTFIDTTDIVHAYDSVRIWSREFSSVSDSAKYNDRTEIFELWSNPKAWHDQIQLTAPYIRVTIDEGNIKQLFAHPEPFVVQQDTSIDRLNQLKGDTLTAFFEDGNMSRMLLEGNTELLRFTKDDQGNPDGVLDSSAPVSIFFFEEGELVEMKHVGSVEGDYLPESPSIVDRKLDGFSWNPELRPMRPKDKMKPRLPEIPENPFFILPTRYTEHLGKQEKSNPEE